MSLKNLLVGLLYRYKLVKQAVLNEYVKEARQKQLQYQQQIQQLINLHKADSLVKKANLLGNLYQQILLAKSAAIDQNKVTDDRIGALIGILGGLGGVSGRGGTEVAPPPRPVEIGKGGKFIAELARSMMRRENNDNRLDAASELARYDVGHPSGTVTDSEGFTNEDVKSMIRQGGGGLPFMGLIPKQLREKLEGEATGFWKALAKAKEEADKQKGGVVAPGGSGQPDGSGSGSSSGWLSEALSAINEHKGQIALGAGGGLLALLGGALLAKKLRNKKKSKKNTAQNLSSDAAAAAAAVEQELKDLATSTQQQQQQKKKK